MLRLRDRSIRTKLILLATASGCTGVLLCCAGFVCNDVRVIRAAKVNQLQAQADVLGFNSSAVLTFRDAPAARQLLSSLHLQPTIELACLFDADGRVLATYATGAGTTTPPPAPEQRGHRYTPAGHLELFHRVIEDGDVVGTLYLRSNMDDFRRQLWEYAGIAAAVMCCSLAASIVLSARLQSGISVPILRLAGTAKKISSEKDYSVRVARNSDDELGSLYSAFNHMLNQIESSDAALQEAHDRLEDRVRERTSQLRTEIRQREKAQVELLRAKEAAESANHAKSQFLANMSHEIRTPLNAVLGFTELLRTGADRGDETEREEYLETVYTSGRHLLNLINDILDLSKVESGQMEVEQVRCSPHEIIAEVVSVLRVRAEESGLKLDCRWVGGVPEAIETDSARLRQLLMNLVGNAIKFTKSGSVWVEAKLTGEPVQSQLEIDVIDTGVGISPDKLERIFDPFVQADASVTREFGGTGLGLAICKRITEALGGTLTVSSQVGRGSTFTATIAIGSLAGVRIMQSPPSDGVASAGRRMNSPAATLPPARILLVEDGDTNRRLIRVMLERAGIQVTTAENGKIGVELAINGAYDLILMDMQMPVMDGYTATMKLRQQGVSVPVIALTAHAMKGDDEKCRAAGCTGYLTKPVDTHSLFHALAEALSDVAIAEPDQPPVAVQQTVESPRLVSTLPADDIDYRDIIEEFVGTLHKQLKAMRQAWAEGDLQELAALAHWLKGTGGTAGFSVFTKPAEELEQLAKGNRLDDIETAVAQLFELASRIGQADLNKTRP